jgi:hypothetical protein
MGAETGEGGMIASQFYTWAFSLGLIVTLWLTIWMTP